MVANRALIPYPKWLLSSGRQMKYISVMNEFFRSGIFTGPWIFSRARRKDPGRRVLVHGTYLLSSSDKNLSAEDIALGYKQLMEVERVFRILKTTVSLRPIYHSKDERIRSHVLLCWLALLLVRIDETKTDLSWPRIRRQTQQLHLGGFLKKKSRVLRHTEPVEGQYNILRKPKVKPPKSVLKVDVVP